MGNGLRHSFTYFFIIKGYFLTAAAQSVERLTAERLTAEREFAGSIPGAGPILRILK